MATNLHNGILTVLLSTSVMMAQLITADIAGSVRDPQGLPVANVRVEALNQRTGQRFATETNSQGEYLIRILHIGDYSMQAEVSGFKSYRRENISLTAAQIARVNIQLEVGAVSEAVTVTTGLRAVDTQTGTLGTLVDTKRLRDL